MKRPKFKVGDRVRLKSSPVTIVQEVRPGGIVILIEALDGVFRIYQASELERVK